MLWKARTRTKIMTVALLWVGVLATGIVAAWIIHPRPNAPAMLGVLLGGGGLSFMVYLYTIMKENGAKTKEG